MAKRNVSIVVGGCAMTEELFKQGLVNDRNMLSASALVTTQNHELVTQVHDAFLKTGATHLVTSNYHVVPGVGFTSEEIREYTRHAGRLAVEAREKAALESSVQICGSLPPLMPSYRADRTIEKDHGHEIYQLIGEALWPFVDLYIAETMSSLKEAQMAYEAVYHLKKPVMVSFALDSTGHQLRSGERLVEVIEKMIDFSDQLATQDTLDNVLSGILFNCSQPEDIAKALKYTSESEIAQEMLSGRGIVLGGYGDRVSPTSKAGILEEQVVAGAMHSGIDMEVYSGFVQRWIKYGASMVGGCCAVPPKYIGHVVEALAEGQTP